MVPYRVIDRLIGGVYDPVVDLLSHWATREASFSCA
jgi:hypothetical protein